MWKKKHRRIKFRVNLMFENEIQWKSHWRGDWKTGIQHQIWHFRGLWPWENFWIVVSIPLLQRNYHGLFLSLREAVVINKTKHVRFLQKWKCWPIFSYQKEEERGKVGRVRRGLWNGTCLCLCGRTQESPLLENLWLQVSHLDFLGFSFICNNG